MDSSVEQPFIFGPPAGLPPLKFLLLTPCHEQPWDEKDSSDLISVEIKLPVVLLHLELLQMLAGGETRTGGGSSGLLSLLCLLSCSQKTALPFEHELPLQGVVPGHLLGGGSCGTRQTTSLLPHEV